MVGAGQLARMCCEAAIPLGLSLAVLARHPDDAAALVTPLVEVGAPDDARLVASFAARCDVLTFDHELVPAELVAAVAAGGVATHPSASALAIAQDKILMRQTMDKLGLPVPSWQPVDGVESIRRFGSEHGWPLVVKRSHGGYDGRGVSLVTAERPWSDLPGPLLVEERVAIRRELAVQVARRPSGQCVAWPVVETVQREGICVEVLAPAPDLPEPAARQAVEIAETIAGSLDVVGVLAVELFDTDRGLLVNEIAVRPHNSGHWTIDGSVTSQFSQHLRAVLDWPLGDTAPTADWTVMANVLGGPDSQPERAVTRVLETDPSARLHLYGKRPLPGRKLGHVTVCGSDLESLRRRAAHAAAVLAGAR